MSRALLVPFFALLAVLLVGPSPSQALSLPVAGLGLDVGNICLPSTLCSAAADFTLGSTVPTTGSFDYTPLGGGTGAMDITLSLSDFSMTGTGPDGVAEILFSSIQISVTGWNTFDPLGDLSSIGGLGAGSATITGWYTQLDGSSGTLVGATGINEVINATNLLCGLDSNGFGQCGFSLGATNDFAISIGDANADTYLVQWTGNYLVTPEPSTALLVGIGLALTGLRRRARA
jgi:hypothetical protein